MRIVIVGFGMAGARLADELSGMDVTVLGAEPRPAYNRILLSSVLAGRHSPDDITLVSRAKAHLGTAATRIDRAAKHVIAGGERFAYDHLVLATGSSPIVPPIPGLEQAFTFRDLDDCERILSAAARAESAIVLGGGLLGLEAARALAGRGLRVDLVHAVGHLMERQLDPGASRVLERTLRDLGVTVWLDAKTIAATATSLTLASGQTLAADLVVAACGVRPCVELARAAGLAVDRGVRVDERLRTNDRRISAIGDCAQVRTEVGGLVAPAWEQARVVAQQLTGADPLAVYHPIPPVTRLKAEGIDLAAMGTLHDASEELSFADPARGTYARLLIRDDRLTGAIMLGDNPNVGRVIQLFDRRAVVPKDRRALLLGRALGEEPSHVDSPALMPDAATVCQCNSVSKGELVRQWREGARGLAELVTATRATTGCGGCRDAVAGIADWLVAA